MSPKLVQTYPNIVQNRWITIARLFWDWYHEKVLPNQLKSLSNLTFSQMLWLFGLFLFTLSYWEQKLIAPEKKWHFGFDSGKNVNFKFIGEDFFMISISKIRFPGFLLHMWISFNKFWWHTVVCIHILVWMKSFPLYVKNLLSWP